MAKTHSVCFGISFEGHGTEHESQIVKTGTRGEAPGHVDRQYTRMSIFEYVTTHNARATHARHTLPACLRVNRPTSTVGLIACGAPIEEQVHGRAKAVQLYLPLASARSISLYCCCRRTLRFSGTGYLLPYEA